MPLGYHSIHSRLVFVTTLLDLRMWLLQGDDIHVNNIHHIDDIHIHVHIPWRLDLRIWLLLGGDIHHIHDIHNIHHIHIPWRLDLGIWLHQGGDIHLPDNLDHILLPARWRFDGRIRDPWRLDLGIWL